MKSEQAQAAQAIRKELKAHGIKATVRSASGSMTSSVSVTLYGATPAVRDAVESFANDYQYGHFDGQTDCYEYSNRQDRPQAKFVFVSNEFTDEDKERAVAWLRDTYVGFEDVKTYAESANDYINGEWLSTHVHQVLAGKRCDHMPNAKRFWVKPSVSI